MNCHLGLSDGVIFNDPRSPMFTQQHSHVWVAVMHGHEDCLPMVMLVLTGAGLCRLPLQLSSMWSRALAAKGEMMISNRAQRGPMVWGYRGCYRQGVSDAARFGAVLA